MPNNGLTVLASAEPYGFGPISKLTALSVELLRRGHQVHFIGTGTALDFAAENRQSFSSINRSTGSSTLREIEAGKYDIALSVMDPILIAWAAAQVVRSVYVDSLFWAWDWPAAAIAEWSEIGAEIEGIRNAANSVAAMEKLPMHTAQFVAHRIASFSCVQQKNIMQNQARCTAALGDVRPVEAIVDLTERRPSARYTWLASTSGVFSELLPLKAGVAWTNIILTLLEDAITGIGLHEPIVLTGNATVLGHSRPARSDMIVKRPLSHRSLLRQLNQSVACMAPPGLTTLLESVGYVTPMILLPAQHYGHTANIRLINAQNEQPTFPGAILPVAPRTIDRDIQQETSLVLGALEEAERSKGAAWRGLVDALTSAMASAENDPTTMMRGQRRAITQLVTGFDGVRQVVEAIEVSA